MVVWHEIWSVHETAVPAFAGMGREADLDGTALLIGWPYDEIYRWYLEMKIDDANGEMTKYNNPRPSTTRIIRHIRTPYNRARAHAEGRSGVFPAVRRDAGCFIRSWPPGGSRR